MQAFIWKFDQSMHGSPVVLGTSKLIFSWDRCHTSDHLKYYLKLIKRKKKQHQLWTENILETWTLLQRNWRTWFYSLKYRMSNILEILNGPIFCRCMCSHVGFLFHVWQEIPSLSWCPIFLFLYPLGYGSNARHSTITLVCI